MSDLPAVPAPTAASTAAAAEAPTAASNLASASAPPPDGVAASASAGSAGEGGSATRHPAGSAADGADGGWGGSASRRTGSSSGGSPYADVPAARAVLAGVVAGGAAIAAAELVAGLATGAPSLVIAMGDLLIAVQPPGAKELVVSLFGTNDKVAVNLLVLVVALVLSGIFGLLARRSWNLAMAGFTLVGVLLLAASLREPLVTKAFAVLVPIVAAVVAMQLCAFLLGLARPVAPAAAGSRDAAAGPHVGAATRPGSGVATRPGSGSASPGSRPATGADPQRRRFLATTAGIAVASIAAGVAGRRLLDATASPGLPSGGGAGTGAPAGAGAPGSPGLGTTAGGLPVPERTAPPIPPAATLDLAGLTPLIVPNDDFYRIDTALIIPRVDAATWTLTVKGMVDHEVHLSYRDLLALPQFEQYVTIACVSNEVGGNLVGNARWQGVHLRDVLAMAGVHAGATQIVGRSVDDFTVGFPTAWAMDPARDPMIALGMNGVPLPVPHGFPARLIIPGLYGYVSATKWLREIELTTLEAFDAYWIPLGWSKEAPILTQSRIDVPRPGARLAAGKVAVGGVAWAPDRGVSAVEVRVQGGEWQKATISAPLANAAWVQWRFDWEATAPGVFDLAVRAIDGTGTPQEERVTPPAPDGARGYHRVSVEISG